MDPDPSSRPPRKVKFPPKAPPRRTSKRINTKNQDDSDDDKAQDDLSQKVHEHLRGHRAKPEKKSSVQVAFTHGNTSNTLRTFGKQKEKIDDQSDANKQEESPLEGSYGKLVTSVSTPEPEELGENLMDLSDGLVVKKKKKEYKEPWDYENSYYPTSLPWRPPNSGDPELLNEAEFADPLEYDENTLSSASALGLLEPKDEPQMIFFQFPHDLPLSGRLNGKGKVESSTSTVSGHTSRTGSSLADLPEGYMGKMLVYKSGAVKLKLGDALFDVSPGSECVSGQSVAAINTETKEFCLLKDLDKRAVVYPDIDSMLG